MKRAIAVLFLSVFSAVSFYGSTPWIDVTAYGATGNGTTNDLPAITNAITACPPGGTVFFPVGTYAVVNTVVLKTPCHLVGQGAGITEASNTLAGSTMTGSNIKAISTFPVNAPVIQFHDVTHASLDGLSIDCSSVDTPTYPVIGLQYDSDNHPPSSFNSFKHFTVKGCHMAFVNGLISSVVTPPADCNNQPSQSGCYQADTFDLDDFIFLGNCLDATGEAIHVNSANAGQASTIGRGNIQCFNVGHHILATNGMLWIQHNNGGSPVQSSGQPRSAFFIIEPQVAGSVNLLDLEVEGGWAYAGLDHGCNPLVPKASNTVNRVSSWIGNAWNSYSIVVDGCDNIFSASNQGNNSLVGSPYAHVTSIGESGWTTDADTLPSLSDITLGTATFGDTVISRNVIAAQGGGCIWGTPPNQMSVPSSIMAGDLQACEGQHTGRIYIGADLALLGNGDGTIDADSPWRFTQVAQFAEAMPPLTGSPPGLDACQGNATTHTLQCAYNGGTFFSQTQTIGSGQIALGTASIPSNTCAPVVAPSGPVSGILLTDAVAWSFSTDPNLVQGYGVGSSGALSIWAFPVANNVNFRVCNLTSAPITPGAVTLNWIVTR